MVGAGVGSFIVLASGSGEEEEPAWSAWQPRGSKVMKVRQIADRIPKSYRAENGSQLTVSIVSPLSVPTPQGDVPVRTVFVRPDTSKGLAEEDDIAVYPGGEVVSFGLCGTKSKEQCELASTSADRDTLLHRQALELSLYTLKYVDDVDSVVVFMPPTPKSETSSTVFLRRSDVADELRTAAERAAADGQAPGRRTQLARGGPDRPAHPVADVCGGGAGVARRQPDPDPDAAGRSNGLTRTR